MQNTIYTDILAKVQTTSDAEALMNQLDQMLANLFRIDKVTFEKNVNHNLNYDIANALKNTIATSGITYANHEEMKSFLTGLKEELKSCQVMTLTIACKPSAELVNSICDWVNENLGRKVLLEVNVDPYILGGAIIIFNGVYMNFSVKKKLEDIFVKNQEAILKQLA